MKRIIKSLIPLFLITSSVFADHSTEKTFLMPRPQGVNLAMEYTTWNKMIQKMHKFRGGTNLAATSFYQESCDSDDLGRYFGIKHKDFIKFDEAHADTRDINLQYIIHNHAPDDENYRAATIKLAPKQKNFGVRLDLYQDLTTISKGFYLKAALPFVYVQNDVRLNVYNANEVNTKRIVDNFFKGKYAVANDNHSEANAQNVLTAAKIDGARSKSGLADLDVIFGYRFINKKRGFAALNLGLTFPTGNTVEGAHLFEPVYGNGNHWAFGAGFDSKVKFLKEEDSYFKFMLIVNYRYLFEGTEKRTIGLKDKYFGHYYLVGKNGDFAGTPAANILTRCLEVTPGSQLDGIAAFAYINGGFVLDVGYNLFWKDSESNGLKDSWKDDYGIVAVGKDFHTTEENVGSLNVNTNADWDGGSFANAKITAAKLDLSAAENPSYLTHKVYAGLGYVFKKWKNQVMVGIGGSYEIADSNNELENWSVWFKGGINF